jgi:hypothetical protein
MNTKTRSAEIARRAIQTVVTTPGCNRKQSAEGVDPYVITFFYREAERLAPNDAILDVAETLEQDAYWELMVIRSVGRLCGFGAEIDPKTLKITVAVIPKPPIIFEAVA